MLSGMRHKHVMTTRMGTGTHAIIAQNYQILVKKTETLMDLEMFATHAQMTLEMILMETDYVLIWILVNTIQKMISTVMVFVKILITVQNSLIRSRKI